MDDTEQHLLCLLFDAQSLTYEKRDDLPPPYTGVLVWGAPDLARYVSHSLPPLTGRLHGACFTPEESADLVHASLRMVLFGFVTRSEVPVGSDNKIVGVLRLTAAGMQLAATLKLLDKLLR